jgi:Ca-activated chloride channel family protein
MKRVLPVAALVILLAPALCAAWIALGQRPTVKPPARPSTSPNDRDQEPADVPGTDDPIKLGAELVNVLFSAFDSNNRVVSDISQRDVTVLEDGRPQQIFTFRKEVNLPINIALLVDLSGSQEYTFPQEKMAAAYFLHSIIRGGKDSAALLSFQDDVDLVQGLTSRMETINRALDEMEYSRRFGPSTSRSQATALYDAVYITVDEVLGREGPRSLADDAGLRRAIILLTDGVDNASNRKLQEAIDRAWRSGVMIYSIGIGDRFRFEGVREDILAKMAEETGGRAYFPRGSDDLMADFRQIESELRSQYLVAYAPSSTSRDGAFHRIDVRLAGRPEVRVLHRRGYYAPTEK